MDGNGRWGKKKGKSRNFGHLKGVGVIEKLVKESIRLKIPLLTFYTFSTENWKRPKKEISFLFNLIEDYFNKWLAKENIKIKDIGKNLRLCLTGSGSSIDLIKILDILGIEEIISRLSYNLDKS